MKFFNCLILSLALIFSTGVVAWADDDSSIFSDDTMTEVVVDSTTQNDKKPLDEKLKIGGDFSFALNPTWSYGNDGQLLQETLGTNLNGRLYFDARPDEDSRYFGKVRVVYPFVRATNVPDTSTPDPNDLTAVETVNLQIQELFSDFNYQNKIFFRAGKQTIKWGVGYFFSPADVLNLAPIDPNDPTAEREGPVSLKLQYPFGTNNFYGYLIANNAKKPSDLALALKGEFLLGNLELGVGGFYQPELAPRAVLMATLPTKSLDFFGELVLSQGSDKNFIEETNDLTNYPLGIKTVQKKDESFPSLTVGFNAMTDKFVVICQYLYNSEGYLEPSLLRDHPLGIAQLLKDGKLGLNDLKQPGRDYVAVSTSFSKLFNNPDLSFSLFWIKNFTDFSELVTPKFSWEIVKKVNISVSFPYSFGETGMEYTPFGATKSVSISVNLGSGSF